MTLEAPINSGASDLTAMLPCLIIDVGRELCLCFFLKVISKY